MNHSAVGSACAVSTAASPSASSRPVGSARSPATAVSPSRTRAVPSGSTSRRRGAGTATTTAAPGGGGVAPPGVGPVGTAARSTRTLPSSSARGVAAASTRTVTSCEVIGTPSRSATVARSAWRGVADGRGDAAALVARDDGRAPGSDAGRQPVAVTVTTSPTTSNPRGPRVGRNRAARRIPVTVAESARRAAGTHEPDENEPVRGFELAGHVGPGVSEGSCARRSGVDARPPSRSSASVRGQVTATHVDHPQGDAGDQRGQRERDARQRVGTRRGERRRVVVAVVDQDLGVDARRR